MGRRFTKKDDNYYLTKAIEEIETIIDYSRGLSIADLNNNPAVLDVIIFRMIQMSEHMEKVCDLFKELLQDIPWINIKGFRNRLVHDYGGVDLGFVYSAITKEIPNLKNQLIKYLNQ